MNFILYVSVFFIQILLCQEGAQSPQKLDLNVVKQTVQEIQAAYKDNPDLKNFYIGIKYRHGIDLPKSPVVALKSLLEASALSPAGDVVITMCVKENCFQDSALTAIFEKWLTKILNEPEGVPQNIFTLLYQLNQSGKLPSALSDKVVPFLESQIIQNPELLYEVGWKISESDPQKILPILHELDTKYNYAQAQIVLGAIEENGEFGSVNFEKAFEYYHKAAQNGSAEGLYFEGQAYLLGRGIAQDREKAFHLMKKAAELNYPAALYDLGVFFINGSVVPLDIPKAINYFKKSAKFKHGDALLALARLAQDGVNDDGTQGKSDYKKAFKLLQEADKYESIGASFDLGFFYDTGLAGIKIDHKKAQELYKKVIDSKKPEADVNKAKMYEYGIGVEQNLHKALEYYQKAMAAGNPFYQKFIDGVKEQIEQEGHESSHDEGIEIPDMTPEVVPRSSRTRQPKQSAEQAIYARRRQKEIEFKDKLNEKFHTQDGSYITDIDFDKKTLIILRPSDDMEVIIKIDAPETVNKKKRQKVKKFIYLPRVEEWFEKLPTAQNAPKREYYSIIRHAFPEIDAIAQLFGYKKVSTENGEDRLTFGIEGSLIEKKFNTTLTGNFLFGYNNNWECYHRFLHTD